MNDPSSPTTEAIRVSMDRYFGTLPTAPEHRTAPTRVAGCPAIWVLPRTVARAEEAPAVVLHLHGGGYRAGSPLASLGLTSWVAVETGVPVLSLAYRLAPEHPFPAALDDAVAAYRWLLDRYGTGRRVAVLGESAGGGLAMALLLAVREAGLEQPAAAAGLSPWLDLTRSAEELRALAHRDSVFDAGRVRESLRAYLAGHDPWDPLVSPVHADVSGLAPVLVHVAEEEVLLDEAVTFCRRVREAGGRAHLETWPEAFHMWHVYCGQLPAAREAVTAVERFLAEHLTG